MSRRGPYAPRDVASAWTPIPERQTPNEEERRTGQKGKPTGRWIGRYRDRQGQSRQAGIFATKRMAREAIAQRVAEANSRPMAPGSPVRALIECIENWPRSEDMHGHTLKTHQERARRVWKALPLDAAAKDRIAPHDLTIGLLKDARRALMDQGLGRKTISDGFAAISLLLRALGEEDDTIVDVARGIRVADRATNYAPRHTREFRAVSPEKVRCFANEYCPDAAVPWLYATTGCRASEGLAINLRARDPEEGTIYLSEVVGHAGGLERGLKTSHNLDPGEEVGRNTLFPQALADLFAKRPIPFDGYLLFDGTPGRRWTQRRFNRYAWGDPLAGGRYVGPMTRYERDRGGRFTPNDLRHSFASWLAEANVPTWIIDTWMGHKDLTMDTPFGPQRLRKSVLGRYYLDEIGRWRPYALSVLDAVIRNEAAPGIRLLGHEPPAAQQ